MKPVFPSFLIALFIFTSQLGVFGQCTIPSLPSCAGCSNLTGSNLNISSGTYCVTTSISNLNLSGSAVICVSGAGQINGGNVNGGTVIYNGSSASNPLNFNVGGGTLRIRSSLTLTNLTSINASSSVIVENSATLTVNNLDINGALYVDQGSTLYSNGNFGINGNGSVCLNNGIVNTNQFTKNDQANSTTTSSRGCYTIRGSVGNFNQVLTNTSNISVCLSGAVPNPNKFGSATVNPNCSSALAGGGCFAALPVRLTSFQAQSFGEGVRLNWTSSLEQNFDYYQVERSTDAVSFETVSPRIASQIEQSGVRRYEWTDVDARSETFYYRLKQVDLDNTYTYSKIVSIAFANNDNAASLKPNPFSDELTITLNTLTNGTYAIELYSAEGKLYASVSGEKNEPTLVRTVATANFPTGFYFTNIRIGDQHFMRKVIKQ
ncbi:T9SS type A sorting domain-containing protein [Spirosoma radiotolerans]|uniref:T9SS type A sorting domain-containing protein n=1 Tax=Spirosoma radiotolerans TaxID=1379870 RepID=UPI00069696F2|nr:T9SS type A sorting domain-containing protein [Spirosoma radiotolerans]